MLKAHAAEPDWPCQARREQAREVLARALRGEQVDREQLAAARSLFSYRSDVPPAAERSQQSQGPAKLVTLGDLLRLAVECNVVELHGTLTLGNGERLER